MSTPETVQADLRDALQFASEALPHDTHPINVARLRVIDQMIVANTTGGDIRTHWSGVLDRAERAADAGLKARVR